MEKVCITGRNVYSNCGGKPQENADIYASRSVDGCVIYQGRGVVVTSSARASYIAHARATGKRKAGLL